MANLLLTTNCQRNCPYCFAKGDRNNGMVMSSDNFMQAVRFIASGTPAINLLGGEPTMHPDFAHMLAFLIEHDFMIQVFTNGMVKREMLDKIISVLNKIVLRDNQLIFAVNINEKNIELKKRTDYRKDFSVI